MSNTCSLCSSTYVWPADLKRHLKSKHGYTFTPEQQQQQPYTFTPEQKPPAAAAAAAAAAAREQQPYSRSNEEEPYYILKTNNPYTFYVPDGYDPDHFMPWVYPFTSVIAGPIRHMMTPIPNRIL